MQTPRREWVIRLEGAVSGVITHPAPRYYWVRFWHTNLPGGRASYISKVRAKTLVAAKQIATSVWPNCVIE